MFHCVKGGVLMHNKSKGSIAFLVSLTALLLGLFMFSVSAANVTGKYQIRYVLNGQNVIDDTVLHNAGDTVTLKSEFNKYTRWFSQPGTVPKSVNNKEFQSFEAGSKIANLPSKLNVKLSTEPNTYTIIRLYGYQDLIQIDFDGNGGNVSQETMYVSPKMSENVQIGEFYDSQAGLGCPQRPGYYFYGWSLKKIDPKTLFTASSQSGAMSYMSYADLQAMQKSTGITTTPVKLYAVWVPMNNFCVGIRNNEQFVSNANSLLKIAPELRNTAHRIPFDLSKQYAQNQYCAYGIPNGTYTLYAPASVSATTLSSTGKTFTYKDSVLTARSDGKPLTELPVLDYYTSQGTVELRMRINNVDWVNYATNQGSHNTANVVTNGLFPELRDANGKVYKMAMYTNDNSLWTVSDLPNGTYGLYAAYSSASTTLSKLSTVTVNNNKQTKTFNYYSIGISKDTGVKSVTRSRAWILKGGSVTVKANMNPGYDFVKWTGKIGSAAYSSAAASSTLTVNGMVSVKATSKQSSNYDVTVYVEKDNQPWTDFDKNIQVYCESDSTNSQIGSAVAMYALTKTTDANGKVCYKYSSKRNLVHCEIYAPLTAAATKTLATGVKFDSKAGGNVVTLSYYTVTLKKGTGVSSVTGSGACILKGQKTSVNATAASGYLFTKWTGTTTSTTKALTLTVDKPYVLTANARPRTLTTTFWVSGGSVANNSAYTLSKSSSGYNVFSASTGTYYYQVQSYNKSFSYKTAADLGITKPGYTFAGWSLYVITKESGSKYTGVYYTPGQIITPKQVSDSVKKYLSNNGLTGKYGTNILTQDVRVYLVSRWTANSVSVQIKINGVAWDNYATNQGIHNTANVVNYNLMPELRSANGNVYKLTRNTSDQSFWKATSVPAGTYDVYAAASFMSNKLSKVGTVTVSGKSTSAVINYVSIQSTFGRGISQYQITITGPYLEGASFGASLTGVGNTASVEKFWCLAGSNIELSISKVANGFTFTKWTGTKGTASYSNVAKKITISNLTQILKLTANVSENSIRATYWTTTASAINSDTYKLSNGNVFTKSGNTYYVQDGKSSKSMVLKSNTDFGLTRNGYKFGGWILYFKDKDGKSINTGKVFGMNNSTRPVASPTGLSIANTINDYLVKHPNIVPKNNVDINSGNVPVFFVAKWVKA